MGDITGEKQRIIEARAETNKAIANHDIDMLTRNWMDDIVIIRGNGSIIQTKKAAKEIWLQMFTQQPYIIYTRKPHTIIININNLFAWENGTWLGANTYSSGGNYAAMWRKQNGKWLLQAELFVALQ